MQAFSSALEWKTAIGTEEQDDDNELLRLLAKGSEDAFSILYERYQRPVFRFAWHMSGNTAIAEEITQEVFMALIRRPKSYDADKGSLGGYLFGIARNLSRRSVAQTRSLRPLVGELDETIDPLLEPNDRGEDILAQLSQEQLIEFLRTAVHSLPESYREVIALCDLEQMSYIEAAELLRCSPGTVASRLHRARALLKTKMLMIDKGSRR